MESRNIIGRKAAAVHKLEDAYTPVVTGQTGAVAVG